MMVADTQPGDESASGLGSTLGAGPPEISTQREAWLGRLRDRLRGRLFGSSSLQAAGFEEFEAPTSAPESGAIPPKIGRYEVIGRIGSGGMGVIYSALDRDLGRKVAVKILNPADALREEQARARLVREAQALAKLSHPGVIHVYEVGSFEDQVFMAMEFVEGTTLRGWQSHADRTWRAVLAAYVAAGGGLAAAHRAGIVHRDFKPDNVLVRSDDEVRVIDFGLARTDAEGGTSGPLSQALEDQSPEAPMTRTGALMGTPAYMAPEQFRGSPADARTDQFSFCVALFEALYGYRPFAGGTVYQLAQNVLHGRVETPPRYTDVPEAVYRALLRGLDVDPNARYPSMRALLAELPSESPRMLRWVASGVVGIGLVTAAGAWWWNSSEDAHRDAAVSRVRAEFDASRTSTAEERLRDAQQQGRRQRWNALVLGAAAEVVGRDPTRALGMLKGIDDSSEEWLAPARVVASAAIERDVLYRTIVADGPAIGEVRVGRDGAIVAYSVSQSPVVRLELTDGEDAVRLEGLTDEVTSLDASDSAAVVVAGDRSGRAHLWVDTVGRSLPRHRKPVTAVAVDAEGGWVATGGAAGTVNVSSTQTESPPRVDAHPAPIVALAFSPDGELFVSADSSGLIKVSRLSAPAPGGTATLLRAFSHRQGVGIRSVHFSSSGSYLDVLGSDGRLWRVETQGWTSQMVEGLEGMLRFERSPSSPTLVTSHRSRGVQVVDSVDAGPRTLRQGKVSGLGVSADGRYVVTASDKIVQLWRLAELRGPRVGVHEAVVVDLAYSPTTGRLAAGASSGMVRVWELPGLEEIELGSLLGGVRALSFSPDGRRLAAVGGSGGMTVWTLDGSAEPRTLSPASSISPPLEWSSDGGVLAAQLCDSPRRCALVVHDIDRGERPLSTTLGVPFRSIELSEDGALAVAVRAGQYDVVSLFDVEEETRRRPPWSEDEAPRRFIAHSFSTDGTSLRLAGRDGDRLSLWQWDLVDDVVVQLDARSVVDAIADERARVVLVRTVEGDEIWPVREPLPQPIAKLPEGVSRFQLSAGGAELLAQSDDGLVLLHLATGIQRSLGDPDGPFAWLGHSGRATTESRSLVRVRVDPTPDDPAEFRRWLSDLTDVDPGEVLVPAAGLGTK